MINEQVQNYFVGRKLQQLYQLVREAYINLSQLEPPHIYLVAEGVGDDIKLKIDDDDLRWVHYVRIQFLKQNPTAADALPLPYRILATRYALLHPMPLHDYHAKWDDGRGVLNIYESRRVGGGKKFEDHFVTHVGDEMRKLYTKATKKPAEPGKAADEEIARWWIEENQNALHDYGKAEVPKAVVKIVRKGGSSVDLAFRKDSRGVGAAYTWHVVKNIGINIEKFRKRKNAEGYNEKMHAGPILRYTKWKEILEPEKEGKGGKSVNPRIPAALSRASHHGLAKTPKKHDHPGFIVPGKKDKEYNPSDEFIKQYNKDTDFREYIETAVIKATASAISFLSANHPKGPVRVRIKYSPDTQHRVSIDSLYQDRGLTENTVNNIMQETRQRFIARTGRIPDEDWKDWKQRFEAEPDEKKGLRGWVYKVMVGSARSAAKDEGVGNQRASSFIAQGSGDPSGGKGDSYQDGGSEELSAFSGAAKGNVARAGQDAPTQQMDAEKRREMQQAIMGALRDPNLLRQQPQLAQRIKALAKDDPMIAQLLDQMGINLDDLGGGDAGAAPAAQRDDDDDYGSDVDYDYDRDDDDDDDYGQGSFGKYGRQGVRREAHNPYSFRSYLANKVNETGVVWGNDKDSAKKLKPGDTLKGGIQVSGAPWSAGGGPNKKDNDIKIKG